MESMKIFAWRYKYLLEIAKYSAQNYLITYLDETGTNHMILWRKYGLTLQKSLIYLFQSRKEKEL